MTQPGLLVSVRNAAEALAALAGGADLIDVKEPRRGPLGAADDQTVSEVVAAVAGRVPISVARGEWFEETRAPIPTGVSYAKWGLARRREGIFDEPIDLSIWAAPAAAVLVAYADYQIARSPHPEWLADNVERFGCRAFLIDTSGKDGFNLLDFLSVDSLRDLRVRVAVPFALAGSLDTALIRELLPLRPDLFAVRGAACRGGRAGTVCADRVRELKAVIAAS